jgi:hypothetical protein
MGIMDHRFSNVPNADIGRSTFKRQNKLITTFDAGYLVPIFWEEVLPGDSHQLSMNGFARMATPVFPVMDEMYMETFFFFIPWRLIWNNFPKFMGERIDPSDSIDYTIPQITDFNNAGNETIYDYFGFPTKVAANQSINAQLMQCYYLVWNEWFRDQNLQDSLDIDKGDGPFNMTDFELQKRGKQHDYFTSCLPWLQKGDAVQMSIGTSADVDSDGNQIYLETGGTTDRAMNWGTDAGDPTRYIIESSSSGSGAVTFGSQTGLTADLSTAVGPTVNDLREAIHVQRLLEKDARTGTRYIEILQSHFGVTSPDYRLQRPEYLGGGRTPVNMHVVPNMTGSDIGDLGAFGTADFKAHGFNKSFVEHGFIIGLVNVRADLTYQEGIERMHSRQTRYDIYWPSLAKLGEQAVLNKEIYVDAATVGAGTDDDVWGYQERWAEYRYKPSRITGKFRSNDAATLDSFHLGIEFGAQPTLDDTFIQDNPPIDRVIATATEPHFLFKAYNNYISTRPMPTYSIPGLTSHF